MMVEEIMQYAEDPEDPTGTVYGFVPTEIANAVVAAHGGLAKTEDDSNGGPATSRWLTRKQNENALLDR